MTAEQSATETLRDFDRPLVHDLTLAARHLLTDEVRTVLEGAYGLHPNGTFEPPESLAALQALPEASETRDRLERYLADEVAAGLGRQEAVEKLVKEAAFTHLNRLVAFKMLEARKLVRGTIDRYHESNAFKFYLVDHPEDMERYEAGSIPQNALGEGPRDVAYRRFLLWQSGKLAQEINVLFDPTNLPSRLFPRPSVLRQLIEMLNATELLSAWAPGNEETIGWVYQYFNEEEKAEVFGRLFKQKQKVRREDIPAATQLFTPNWIVRWIVQNTVGRMWVQMHPDSSLAHSLDYLVPLEGEIPAETLKPVREIQILDPACGTMHFGLVAFDVLTEMYKEEIEHAGEAGWPKIPSVDSEEDIPASIIANNLFGIDIDLRAVQLSAMTLYLKAKSHNKQAVISSSNLACADVLPLNGQLLNAFLDRMKFSRPIYERLIRALWTRLRDASYVGSLLRLEDEIQSLVERERRRYGEEAAGRLPFPELTVAFEEGAAESDFWLILEEQIIQGFDEFARQQAAAGDDESYFAGEATKGMRLLDVMRRRYDVVVTNPPYMSDRSMNSAMVEFMKKAYPTSKGDLYAAFIDRCSGLLTEHGRLGMITQQSFLFLSSYEKLRTELLEKGAIETMCHVGPRAFDEIGGEKVNTVLFALRAEPSSRSKASARGMYFRLVKEATAEAKRRGFEHALDSIVNDARLPETVYRYHQADFRAVAGSPWVYWITPGVRQLFSSLSNLRTISPPKHGMTTSDNFRFLRRWWEVGAGHVERLCTNTSQASHSPLSWFPYMKGGEAMPWWGNQEYVVNWRCDGVEMKAYAAQLYKSWSRTIENSEFYFRRGVTWTDLTSGRFHARLSPGGFIFDVKGSSAFPENVPLVLGLLNSSFAQYTLNLLNPTVSFQVGDLARLPIPNRSSKQLDSLVYRAVKLVRQSDVESETTYDFVAPPAWETGIGDVAARQRELAVVELEIDEEVYRLYDIGPTDRAAIEQELGSPPVESEEVSAASEDAETESGSITRNTLANRWISYAVGTVLGKFQPGIEGGLGRSCFPDEVNRMLRGLADEDGIVPLDSDLPNDLAQRAMLALEFMLGEAATQEVIRLGTGGQTLAWYLERDFFRQHVQAYRKRPIYWLLQSPKRAYSVYVFHERITRDTLYLLLGNTYLGGKINAVRGRIEELQARTHAMPQGRERRAVEREQEAMGFVLTELEFFAQALQAVTSAKNERGEEVGWDREIDDGVLINLAPLHTLMPAWSSEPKKAWESLRKGEWDWSHTAMRYWPDRVLEKCRTNKSYAIAHNRLDVYKGGA